MVDTQTVPHERPLSPHLQIYRWTIPMALSILHRITGMALAFGTLLLAWWLVAAALGPQSYAQAHALLGSWFGMLVLAGFSFALVFHFLNGIRHLVWDVGLGFEVKTARASGWFVLALAVALTALIWYFACPSLGGGTP